MFVSTILAHSTEKNASDLLALNTAQTEYGINKMRPWCCL